jgi:hypothetical protein
VLATRESTRDGTQRYILKINKAERIGDLWIKGLLRTLIRQALPATGEHG